MAVLRHNQLRPQLPADFGLGLAVAAILGALILLGSVAIASMPSEGPKGQSREPGSEVYIDLQPPPPPGSVGAQ